MKLNLRDLFWLVFVAALCCAWWVDRARLVGRVKQLEETIRNISPGLPHDLDLHAH